MKIQAINFKAPVIKTNLSFKDRDVIINKDGIEQDVFICSQPKIDPKKEFRGRQIQADSLNVLSWANSKQKEAKKMYAEAEKIHRAWQKQKPALILTGQVSREFYAHAGKLEQYIETRSDGSKLIVGYFPEGPYNITQIDKDGKENIYLFCQNGKLAEYTEGKSEKETSRNHIITKEGVYSYSNGYLSSYAKNLQTIHTFGDFLKGQTDVVADMKMFFEFAGKRPYLKKAETETGTSNGEFIAPEDVFLYDKFGKLIEAR